MLVYLAMCCSCLLLGYGTLALLGLHRNLPGALLAAPGIGLVLQVVVTTNGIWFGWSGGHISFALIGLVLCLGGAGLFSLIRSPPPAQDFVAGLVAALCPILVLAPFFRWGLTAYPGSWFWDGWAYLAQGQYLLDRFEPATYAGSLVYEFGESFWIGQARYSASALIAILSVLIGGSDTQPGFGPFIALVTFVFANACGFIAVARRSPPAIVVAYILFAATGGWLLAIVQANNLDSLLVGAFGPMLLGLVLARAPGDHRDGILFGLVFASVAWAQIELLPIVASPAALLLLHRFVITRHLWRQWLYGGAAAATMFIIAAGAWLAPATRFLINQWDAVIIGVPGHRPGNGYFRGFFDARCSASTWWGLWGPFDPCENTLLIIFVAAFAAILTILLAIGMTTLLRNREFGIVGAAGLVIVGAVYMIVAKTYDYGAYKFLSSNWYLFAFIVIEGLSTVALSLATPFSLVAAVVLLPHAITIYFREARFDATTRVKDISFYAQVSKVRPIIGNSPVVVAINDLHAFQWLLLHLRDLKLVPVRVNQAYMSPSFVLRTPLPQVRPQLVGRTRLVITEAHHDLACFGFELIWQGGAYRLWQSKTPNTLFDARLADPDFTREITGLSCRTN